MFLFTSKKQDVLKENSGFSLIELMVTITIVTLITGMVMAKYSSFNNVVLLKSQAYELALDIREAQIFGVSARGEGSEFREAYGIFIDTHNAPSQYILFQDDSLGNELAYDQGEQIGQSYTIDPRFEITEICDNNNCNRTKTSIAFKRPDFDAHIRVANGNGSLSNTDESFVSITLAPINDGFFTQTVSVYQSGQISVN